MRAEASSGHSMRNATNKKARLTTQEVVAREMLEAELQANVIGCAEALGYTVIHIRDSRRQQVEGLPDLLMIHPPRLLWAELKREKAKLTGIQLFFKALLVCSGEEYWLWRPSDWLSGEVERVLNGT